MKIKAKFYPGYTMLLSSKMEFQGKGSVQLQEIGIHADGDVPRFTLPVLGRFYAPLFNARTSRTIPYSRITEYRYTGNWINLTVGKTLLMLFLWISTGTLTYGVMNDFVGNQVSLSTFLFAIWGFIGLITVLLLFKDRQRHRLSYRLPNEKIQKIQFRLRKSSYAQIQGFRKMLIDYRSKASAVVSDTKPQVL